MPKTRARQKSAHRYWTMALLMLCTTVSIYVLSIELRALASPDELAMATWKKVFKLLSQSTPRPMMAAAITKVVNPAAAELRKESSAMNRTMAPKTIIKVGRVVLGAVTVMRTDVMLRRAYVVPRIITRDDVTLT